MGLGGRQFLPTRVRKNHHKITLWAKSASFRKCCRQGERKGKGKFRFHACFTSGWKGTIRGGEHKSPRCAWLIARLFFGFPDSIKRHKVGFYADSWEFRPYEFGGPL